MFCGYEITDGIDVSLLEWSKIEEKFWGMQDMSTRLLSANLDFDSRLTSLVVYLTNVPTLETFALIRFFSVFWSELRTWLAVL